MKTVLLALSLLISSPHLAIAFAGDAECCEGSCWADGCCPGMPRCSDRPPIRLPFPERDPVGEAIKGSCSICGDDFAPCLHDAQAKAQKHCQGQSLSSQIESLSMTRGRVFSFCPGLGYYVTYKAIVSCQ